VFDISFLASDEFQDRSELAHQRRFHRVLAFSLYRSGSALLGGMGGQCDTKSIRTRYKITRMLRLQLHSLLNCARHYICKSAADSFNFTKFYLKNFIFTFLRCYQHLL